MNALENGYDFREEPPRHYPADQAAAKGSKFPWASTNAFIPGLCD